MYIYIYIYNTLLFARAVQNKDPFSTDGGSKTSGTGARGLFSSTGSFLDAQNRFLLTLGCAPSGPQCAPLRGAFKYTSAKMALFFTLGLKVRPWVVGGL